MKKALILLVPALALLASCGDAIEIPDVSGSGNVPVIDPEVPLSGDVVFTGTIEDLPDGSQAVWAQGESILFPSVTLPGNSATWPAAARAR